MHYLKEVSAQHRSFVPTDFVRTFVECLLCWVFYACAIVPPFFFLVPLFLSCIVFLSFSYGLAGWRLFTTDVIIARHLIFTRRKIVDLHERGINHVTAANALEISLRSAYVKVYVSYIVSFFFFFPVFVFVPYSSYFRAPRRRFNPLEGKSCFTRVINIMARRIHVLTMQSYCFPRARARAYIQHNTIFYAEKCREILSDGERERSNRYCVPDVPSEFRILRVISGAHVLYSRVKVLYGSARWGCKNVSI